MMGGPNDIGVLRGIIGDGTSMNDEDMRTKAYGKRPGAEKHLVDVKVPKMDAAKEFTFFKKDNKNPMDVMKKFNLGTKNISNNNPHVVNKILRDNYGLNKGNPEQWEAKTIWVKPGAVGDTSLGDQKKAEQFKTEQQQLENVRRIDEAKTNKTLAAIALEQQAARIEYNKSARVRQATREASLADQIKRRYEAQVAAKEAYEKTSPGMTLIQPSVILPRMSISWKKGEGLKFHNRGTTEFTTAEPIEMPKPKKLGQEFREFAGELSENLGKTLSSGTLVSPFRQQDTKDISLARLELQAYYKYLQKKYKTQDLNSANITGKEQYKIESMKAKLGEKQRILSQGEFLSGSAAMPMLMTSQPRMNLQPYTQSSTPRIAFSELGQGISYPEASARLGVSQGLSAYDQNKWDTVLSRNNPSDKITNILGKKPDPTGSGETASAKIKRLSGL